MRAAATTKTDVVTLYLTVQEHAVRLETRLEPRDIGLDRVLTDVGDWADADRLHGAAGPGCDARIGIGIGGSEFRAVAPFRQADDREVAGPGRVGMNA
jgi:hypothetical protein